MRIWGWPGRQAGLVAAGLALLAGAPAVLAALRIRDPRALAGVAAGAAVLVAAGAVWQARWQRLAARDDQVDFGVLDGCLVLAGGRLPLVGRSRTRC